ncbi:MAG: phosphatidylglycerophosphatase A [Phycisphaerales bacterium]|nr:phosphatidylglycerophosphatase A [Phycisphaerales bacterium]
MSPRRLLLTVGGLGLIRPAPGTWGSLPPVVVAIAMLAGGCTDSSITAVMTAIVVVFSAICIVFGRFAERSFGGKDPSSVVADETAGQALAYLAVAWPGTAADPNWLSRLGLLAVGFVAFRFFDITKIGGARQAQVLPAGWGVVVDDLIAGVYAWLVTFAAARWLFAG